MEQETAWEQGYLPRILQKKLKSHMMPIHRCGPVATLVLTNTCSAEIMNSTKVQNPRRYGGAHSA